MTDCDVTLALAYGPSEPYASDHIKVAAAEEYTAGVYLVTTAYEQIPLTNPAGVVPFPQGEVFGVLEPGDVEPKFLLIPNTSTANYVDLQPAVPVIDPPGHLGDTVIYNVLANVDSESRRLIDEVFSETAVGAVTDGAVGALVNNGAATKDALGDEAADDASPLAGSIDDRADDRIAVQYAATKTVFNVHDYGAIGDGVADDTAAIQAAINAAAGPTGSFFGGGGIVAFRSGGTYMATQLRLKSSVTLDGGGMSTQLKQIAATTADFIVLDTINEFHTGIRYLTINGNRANQTAANRGIFLSHTGASSSVLPCHVIDHVHVRSTLGDGISLGDFTRATQLTNFVIYSTGGYGLVLGGADSEISNGDVGQTDKSGVYIPGTAYLIQNIKSWYTGRSIGSDGGVGAGFWVSGNRNNIKNCNSQEAGGPGLNLFRSGNTVVGTHASGFTSDSDNVLANNYAGVQGFNVTDSKIDALVTNTTGLSGQTRNGLVLTGTSLNNDIAVRTQGVSSNALGSVAADNRVTLLGRSTWRVRTYAATFSFGGTIYDAETHVVTLTGGITFTSGAAPAGMTLRIVTIQDATGGRSTTFGSGFTVPAALAIATGPATEAVYEFISDGTTWVLKAPTDVAIGSAQAAVNTAQTATNTAQATTNGTLAPKASPSFTGNVSLPNVITSGSESGAVTPHTTTTALTSSSTRIHTVDAAGGNFNVTPPSTGNAGIRYLIKKITAAGTVTVVGTIDGATNFALTTQYSWVEIITTTTPGTFLIIGKG